MTKRSLLTRIWPKSLTAQLVCLLLGAIILTHIVLGVMLAEERRDAVESERRGNALMRVAAISRILTTTPQENWADVLRVAQSPQNRLRLVPESSITSNRGHVSNVLTRRLNDTLSLDAGVPARVEVLSEAQCQGTRKSLRHDRKIYLDMQGDDHSDRRGDDDEKYDGRHEDRRDELHDDHPRVPWSLRYLDRFDCDMSPVMRLVAPITVVGPNGDPKSSTPDIWLEAMIGGGMPPPWFVADNFLRVMASGLVIAVIAFFLARRISRSWDALTRAADRVGRGDYPEPVPETGPIEIRRATKAFNRMTTRLKRFVEDRTRMLAAISHDLRTPITSLRLRAEFVDDPENRARIIETLDEMEQMVEAAMTFAREETANEETRKIDLAALVESAVEDLAETGRPIRFVGEVDSRVYPCRPLSIKRAFGNLVSNALSFGDMVEVTIRDADDGGLWIEIADDGPGIPVDHREQVFEPFFRMEESRNRDTGGIGLGLAIARTAIRAHGGEIYLEESQKGGLLARIYLPPAQPQ